MEKPKQHFDSVTDRLKNYLNLKIEIIKLKAIEKLVTLISSILVYILIAIFGLIFLLAGFFALGFYLAELTNSNACGFGLLTAILLVIIFVLFFIKDKYLIKPIESKFIANIFKNW